MFINTDFLTQEELAKYRECSIKIAEIESIATYREIQDQKKSMVGRDREGVVNKTIKLDIEAYKIFKDVGICKSYGEAKRLISQGGLSVNGETIKDPYIKINRHMFNVPADMLILQKGKKRFYEIDVKATNNNI